MAKDPATTRVEIADYLRQKAAWREEVARERCWNGSGGQLKNEIYAHRLEQVAKYVDGMADDHPVLQQLLANTLGEIDHHPDLHTVTIHCDYRNADDLPRWLEMWTTYATAHVDPEGLEDDTEDDTEDDIAEMSAGPAKRREPKIALTDGSFKIDSGLMYCATRARSEWDSSPESRGFIHRPSGKIVFLYEADAEKLELYFGKDASEDAASDRAAAEASPEDWIEIPKCRDWCPNQDKHIEKFLQKHGWSNAVLV